MCPHPDNQYPCAAARHSLDFGGNQTTALREGAKFSVVWMALALRYALLMMREQWDHAPSALRRDWKDHLVLGLELLVWPFWLDDFETRPVDTVEHTSSNDTKAISHLNLTI